MFRGSTTSSSPRHEYQLLGLQYNRIADARTSYLYGGSLNFGYVPVYGKFAWFNKRIVHWEIWASAGLRRDDDRGHPPRSGDDSKASRTPR